MQKLSDNICIVCNSTLIAHDFEFELKTVEDKDTNTM